MSDADIIQYPHSTDNNRPLDSDDDFRSGWRNVSHHYRQQPFSGLHSPGRSNYTITLFISFQVFFSDVLAATLISVFSVWSFSLVVFLCKRDCFAGKNEIWSVSTSLCRARDHNLAGVALITWRSFSLKTHDDFLFQRGAFPISFYRIRVKKKSICVY